MEAGRNIRSVVEQTKKIRRGVCMLELEELKVELKELEARLSEMGDSL